jgi:plastocyanin
MKTRVNVNKHLTVIFLQVNEYEVTLLNASGNGTMIVFEPNCLKIAAGDIVNFITSDASHNVQPFSMPSEKSTFTTPCDKTTKVTFSE